MESHEQGELQAATRVLRHALAEACGTEIKQANTGELARIEEVLVVATEAARQVVALRREAKRSGTAITAETAAAEGDAANHRVFVDAAGVTWDAFAVHPSGDGGGRARLPEPYQRGWLSFDSGDERRRLSPIPEGWPSLSEEALREACARAEPAARRLPSPAKGKRPDGA